MVAVNRASGGGGQRQQAMPSLPSGTASSQPPRTILSEAEIDAVLVCVSLKSVSKFSTYYTNIIVFHTVV